MNEWILVRRLEVKYKSLLKPFAFISIYAIWVLVFKLLTLTFITYFTISPGSRFQDISDAFGSNEVSLMGLSAILFVALLHFLNPLTTTTLKEIIDLGRIKRSFYPGFIQGLFFAGGILLAFLLGRTYRYLGSFIQFNEAPLELANVVLRMGALTTLAYCEEFIFHYKLTKNLNTLLPDSAAACLIAVIYCGIKLLQFDLGAMHLITLFLVSVSLFYRTRIEGHFAKAAGFWAGILILFHPVLSLPIFGNNFPGILLIKYQASSFSGPSAEGTSSAIRILTGGVAGPLSSFAFQLLLILDIGRSILRRKRS